MGAMLVGIVGAPVLGTSEGVRRALKGCFVDLTARAGHGFGRLSKLIKEHPYLAAGIASGCGILVLGVGGVGGVMIFKRRAVQIEQKELQERLAFDALIADLRRATKIDNVIATLDAIFPEQEAKLKDNGAKKALISELLIIVPPLITTPKQESDWALFTVIGNNRLPNLRRTLPFYTDAKLEGEAYFHQIGWS